MLSLHVKNVKVLYLGAQVFSINAETNVAKWLHSFAFGALSESWMKVVMDSFQWKIKVFLIILIFRKKKLFNLRRKLLRKSKKKAKQESPYILRRQKKNLMTMSQTNALLTKEIHFWLH